MGGTDAAELQDAFEFVFAAVGDFDDAVAFAFEGDVDAGAEFAREFVADLTVGFGKLGVFGLRGGFGVEDFAYELLGLPYGEAVADDALGGADLPGGVFELE